MLVHPMLRIDLRYCAMCACIGDTLYMYPISKHGLRVQSRVQHSRLLSNCASSAEQGVGTRNRAVMYNVQCTLHSLNMNMEFVCSPFLFLNEYWNFIRSPPVATVAHR